MTTLIDRLTGWMASQCNKHGLHPEGPDAYIEEQVNSWTNYELLKEISDALEEIGIDFSNPPKD